MDDILKGKKAALIDMDGVIYDSMKYHAEAFRRLFEEEGVPGNPEDVYLYEGMRGADLVNMMYMRAYGHGVSKERAAELYELKSKYFYEIGRNEPMAGADRMLDALKKTRSAPRARNRLCAGKAP